MSYPRGGALGNRNCGAKSYQKGLVNGYSRFGVVLLLFFSIVTGSLPQLRAENRMIDDYSSNSNIDTERGEEAQAKEPKGLQFRLSQGQEQPEARVKSQVTPSSPLSEGELASSVRNIRAKGVCRRVSGQSERRGRIPGGFLSRWTVAAREVPFRRGISMQAARTDPDQGRFLAISINLEFEVLF